MINFHYSFHCPLLGCDRDRDEEMNVVADTKWKWLNDGKDRKMSQEQHHKNTILLRQLLSMGALGVKGKCCVRDHSRQERGDSGSGINSLC